jgi:hypothetical protein
MGIRGFVLYVAFIFTGQCFAHELERIVEGYPTLESFFSDEAALQRYLRAAQARYGGRDAFPDQSFYKVIETIRQVTDRSARISQLLWAPRTTLGPSIALPIEHSIIFQRTSDARSLTRAQAVFYQNQWRYRSVIQLSQI